MFFLPSRPANPQIGDIFYDSYDDVMKAYDGSSWIAILPMTTEELMWAECNNIEHEKMMGTYEHR